MGQFQMFLYILAQNTTKKLNGISMNLFLVLLIQEFLILKKLYLKNLSVSLCYGLKKCFDRWNELRSFEGL